LFKKYAVIINLTAGDNFIKSTPIKSYLVVFYFLLAHEVFYRPL